MAASIRALVLAGAVLGCAGCVIHLGGGGPSRELEKPSLPGRALLVGYLDMKDAQGKFDFVQLHHLVPGDPKPYYHMRLDHGVYYTDVAPPGPYVLDQFGEWGGFDYELPRQSSPVHVVAERPDEIYYLGAFRLVSIRRAGRYHDGNFDLKPMPHPTEAEALAVVLKHAGGTAWEARIQAFLGASR